jgi:hypothetical protein
MVENCWFKVRVTSSEETLSKSEQLLVVAVLLVIGSQTLEIC